MKKVKCFVLSLFICFSFGCTTYLEDTRINIKVLLKNVENIESYQCSRFEAGSPFICTLRTATENKLVKCTAQGCHFEECKNDVFCFQSSNDTE